jgi:DNA-binding transcriptional ArsR family regulator
METNKRKAVLIVKNPDAIPLLANLINSEILRLLSKRPMTETQLSKELGLTKAAIGYHLHPLRDAGLIEINRYETGEHGISKYYSAAAALFIVDPDQISGAVKRYFLETQIDHLEGIMSLLKLHDRISEVSSENLEEMAKAMLRQLKVVGQRYVEEEVGDEDAESLRVKIYAEALANLTKKREWPILKEPLKAT